MRGRGSFGGSLTVFPIHRTVTSMGGSVETAAGLSPEPDQLRQGKHRASGIILSIGRRPLNRLAQSRKTAKVLSLCHRRSGAGRGSRQQGTISSAGRKV